jgi:hypothetical protein
MITPITLEKEDEAPEENTDLSETIDPNGIDTSDDLPIWEWDPPSGSFRSSPTPPAD